MPHLNYTADYITQKHIAPGNDKQQYIPVTNSSQINLRGQNLISKEDESKFFYSIKF